MSMICRHLCPKRSLPRDFLKATAAAGGGLMLASPSPRLNAARAARAATRISLPNAFIRIDPDGKVTLHDPAGGDGPGRLHLARA